MPEESFRMARPNEWMLTFSLVVILHRSRDKTERIRNINISNNSHHCYYFTIFGDGYRDDIRFDIVAQQAHNVNTTSPQRRCNVITLHRR